MTEPGKIWGVGVGPGDPELLTLKAHRIITTADVVAYPAPNNGNSVARSIVADYLKDNQTEFAIRISMDPAQFPPRDIYQRAADDIFAHSEEGRSVAVLCEGDPFFYGSFMYLFERLAIRKSVEIVPGVSSMTASAAALQIPLASRNDVISVIPATLDASEIKERLKTADMAIFIKVGRHLGKIKTILDEVGLFDKANYIERATMQAEKTSSLADIVEDTAPYFSIIMAHRRGAAL
ncbi:MAG: precorrin-2 C(20)-methyltransferase [Rhodospirillaceae bacterium]|nr:precorrin-2 C(20)-methyltransferase [Rhodospirillaceae bacterium]